VPQLNWEGEGKGRELISIFGETSHGNEAKNQVTDEHRHFQTSAVAPNQGQGWMNVTYRVRPSGPPGA